MLFVASLLNLNIQLADGWGWEAGPLFAAGGDGAEASGAGLKSGKHLGSEGNSLGTVLRARIEEGQIVTGEMQVLKSFGVCALNQVNFNIDLRAA